MSQSENPNVQARNGFNPLLFICQSWVASVEVMLHGGQGRRYFGNQAAAVLLLVPLFSAAVWPHNDFSPMLLFLAFYLVMVAWARLVMVFGRRRLPEEYSFYTGYPRLLRIIPFCGERTCKRIVEPLFLFAVGGLVCAIDEPLGSYLMGAAFCLLVMTNLGEAREYELALDINDAVIEQQFRAERFRTMRGDRF